MLVSRSVVFALLFAVGPGAAGATIEREAVRKAAGAVRTPKGPAPESVVLERDWEGDFCRSTLTNTGAEPVRVKEVVLFRVAHALAPSTPFYGEGFQMLSQTGGTLGKPAAIGGYTDKRHYKLPEPGDATVVYNLLTLAPEPEGADRLVFAFTSCRRFAGRFEIRRGSIAAVLDAEGLEIAPGERWELEEVLFARGPNRPALLERLADRLAKNHPPRKLKAPPTGWCSWYAFGSKVTADKVLANVDVLAEKVPGLRYVQLDDGYQRAMGDWLEPGPSFGGDARGVLAKVKEKGFEPALWVAPFIAEKDSHLFGQHPDWFVKDDKGDPLPSNKVTFGGWRKGPWYALDGTHPDARAHLENLFRTLRDDWGVRYFKLDANVWGALHGGRFHDPKATRVEAYRRGMGAIRKGAGDAFVLGCNHPVWASLGLIDGSRTSGDVARKWPVMERSARETLSRNWQNGRLWWNDPDCLLLTADVPEPRLAFHAATVFAAGGLVLSGDDLTRIDPDRFDTIARLLPPTGTAASFATEELNVGRVALEGGKEALCLFNWTDEFCDFTVKVDRPFRAHDLWADRDLGRFTDVLQINLTPAHSARVLVLTFDKPAD